MKKEAKILALLSLSTLLGGWALPSRDVKANDIEKQEKVQLTLTAADVTVAQFSEFDARDLVVSGAFDSLQHSIVDTSVVGKVSVTYIASKGLETIKLSKTIDVRDGIAPEIDGSDTIELKYDSEYNILDAYTATDNIDEDVTLEVVGDVDRLTAGEYEIVIKATDSSDNVTTKEVVVTVNEDPEVIALRERNAELAVLVDEANALNATLLADTTVSAVESMLNRVNNAKGLESDHASTLANLSSELAAKLVRAKEYHAPAPAPVAQTQQAAPAAQTQQPAQQAAPVAQAQPTVGSRSSNSVNTYGAGWCTWWVADQRAAWGNPIPNNWGNAISWYGNAAAQGYGVGSVPAAGAIAYFPGANHVAFVESVNGNGTITISEMGYGFRAWGFNRRTISASSASYIY